MTSHFPHGTLPCVLFTQYEPVGKQILTEKHQWLVTFKTRLNPFQPIHLMILRRMARITPSEKMYWRK